MNEPVRQVRVIGIGTGSLDHLTREAITAITETTVFLAADKRHDTADMVELRRQMVRSVRGDEARGYRLIAVPDPKRGPDADRDEREYEHGVRTWHEARVDAYAEVIEDLDPDDVIGFLVWGDPAFYDSTIRIVDALRERFAVQVKVFPGISAVQALAAAHQIVLNPIGGSIHVTTGRRLLEEYSPSLGTVVVMLDGSLHCAELLEHWPDLYLYWGAYLGSPQQVVVAGRLDETVSQVRELRARLRAEHGWLMDTYAITPTPLS